MPSRAVLILACVCFATAVSAAQAQGYRAPRTSFGHPDLQGVWGGASHTPLQRPKDFTELVATPEQEAKFVADAQGFLTGAPGPDGKPKETDGVGGVESEWYEMPPNLMRIDGQRRTSIIIDPADGRLPYNLYGRRAVADAFRRDEIAMDSAEDRQADERCMLAGGSSVGPPMLPAGQNGHYQIVQTPDAVAIHVEMIHDVRIIPLGGAHTSGPPRWMGHAVGRWEGDTLVVETVNQHPLSAVRFVGPGILQLTPAAKVVERFTRISPTEIRYTFTVEDPALYTQPWSGEVAMRTTDARMFEYACHEGNYALANILGGARKQEQDAAKTTPTKAAQPETGTSETPS